MQPRIESLKEKKLVGNRIQSSFADNKTRELWQGFMPLRKEIHNAVSQSLYSVEVYPAGFFDQFDPSRSFEKWAALEVEDFNRPSPGFVKLVIPEGLYAVFVHRGPASQAEETYNHIFLQWLPGSAYLLDHRPHFALMDEKYRPEATSTEEEIWIPVRPRT